MLLTVLLEAAAAGDAWVKISACIGVALVVLSASLGIAHIGAKAMEAMARQPESIGDLRSSMIVAAALIEGAAFFAIIVCSLAFFM